MLNEAIYCHESNDLNKLGQLQFFFKYHIPMLFPEHCVSGTLVYNKRSSRPSLEKVLVGSATSTKPIAINLYNLTLPSLWRQCTVHSWAGGNSFNKRLDFCPAQNKGRL